MQLKKYELYTDRKRVKKLCNVMLKVNKKGCCDFMTSLGSKSLNFVGLLYCS